MAKVMSSQVLPPSKLFEIPRQQWSERYETLQLGGEGEPASMICGLFQMEDLAAQQLIALLPGVITVDTWADSDAQWMRSTLRMIAVEGREFKSGGETVITRLADILVVQAIRHWLAQVQPQQAGWLKALKDRQLGPAIAKIYRRPESRWTLDSLAAEASMSRSAFSVRFTELVGQSAMNYIARCQMIAARSRLIESNLTVGEVAHLFGYDSEAAFHRAFKRHVGVSPGAVKRARLQTNLREFASTRMRQAAST